MTGVEKEFLAYDLLAGLRAETAREGIPTRTMKLFELLELVKIERYWWIDRKPEHLRQATRLEFHSER